MWADILLSNKQALAGPLLSGAERAAALGRAIESGDARAVETILTGARDQLARGGANASSGGAHPEISAAKSAAPKE
jgi:hypothetical protein